MHASDVWIETLAIFISQRCDLFRLIRCLPKMSPSSLTSTGSQIATWRRSLTWTRRDFNFNLRPPSTGKMFVWSLTFLPEPGSARYSSAPSITTVWSNYQTSYNDFFEVYITETVTLSPMIQMVPLTSSVQLVSLSTNVTWLIVLCPHWSKVDGGITGSRLRWSILT